MKLIKVFLALLLTCTAFFLGYWLYINPSMPNIQPNSATNYGVESETGDSTCDRILNSKASIYLNKSSRIPNLIDYSRLPDAKLYRAKIEESVANGANFAGHFNVATWGCGTDCFGYSIVDMDTGKVVKLSTTNEDSTLSEFNVNTRYLVHNPILAGENRSYYELEEGKDFVSLNLVCTEKSKVNWYSNQR